MTDIIVRRFITSLLPGEGFAEQDLIGSSNSGLSGFFPG